jgi:hypothetical protein
VASQQSPTAEGRKLAVVPFQDERPPRKYTTAGKMFLVYVPLLPYVPLDFERLDESMRIQGEQISGRGLMNKPPEDSRYMYPVSFPRAIADDLRSSGLFRDVTFVEDGTPSGYDLVLTGALRESPMRLSASSYLLGVPGVLLWFLPIPNQRTTAEVVLDVRVREVAMDATVWEQSLRGDVSRFATLYTPGMTYGRAGPFAFNLLPVPKDAKVDRASLFSWHFEALRRAMEEARPELAAALR